MIIEEKVTVEEWAKEWLITYKQSKVGLGTYKDYEQKVRIYIIPHIGSKILSSVRHYQLQHILNQQNRSKSNAKKLKITIEQIFKTAHLNELIHHNPAVSLELPNLVDGKRRSITDDERKIILRVADTHRAGLWLKFILFCGLRPSEAIALKWDDIDFNAKTVEVKRALESRTNKIKPPKTEAGYRVIPIPEQLLCILQDAYNNKKADYIFTQPTTTKLHTVESMRCMWENFKREMNIQMGAKMYRSKIEKEDELVGRDLTPYCLRHTYCTDLQNAGVPINVAKYLMGHSDIRVTANIYTHHTEDVSKSAIKAMEHYYAIKNKRKLKVIRHNTYRNKKFALRT